MCYCVVHEDLAGKVNGNGESPEEAYESDDPEIHCEYDNVRTREDHEMEVEEILNLPRIPVVSGESPKEAYESDDPEIHCEYDNVRTRLVLSLPLSITTWVDLTHSSHVWVTVL
ncbi:hypothetical protein Hamer_G009783 [Homarus americanus]|uniref:Uncharacterized protein n=1 Tax=Homarus americanus TaxID=6706 RepID=A0A8J5TN94_HOMAM|nr:hypothetical protein Hamer_G009783 [Homarus americanus]